MSVHQRNLRTEARQRLLFLVAGAVLAFLLAFLLAWFVRDTAFVLSRFGILPVFLGTRWAPDAGWAGLLPFEWGSAVVGALALVVAVLLGGPLAVVVRRRVPARAGRVLTAALAGMVAIPSVLWGWWGLDTVVPAVRAGLGGPGFSLLAAGLTLGVMLVPTFAALGAEAVGAVPEIVEDAARALGATEDQTLWSVTLVAALPGFVRALVVAAGRALAETMAVQMVIGGQPTLTLRLTAPGSTLTTAILTQLSVYPPGTGAGRALTVMGAVLLAGTWWLARELKRWEGAP